MELYFTIGITCGSMYLLAYFINVAIYKFTDHRLLNGVLGETETDEDLFFGTMLTVLVAMVIAVVVPIIIFSAILFVLTWFIRRIREERKEEPEPERGLRIIKNN